MTKTIESSETKEKKIYIPFLSILFGVYCIVRRVPEGWFFVGILTTLIDLFWNPIYILREYDGGEKQ